MKPSLVVRAVRSLSLVAGLALAIGATGCTASEEDDADGTHDALSGTPGSDRPGEWKSLYAEAYADDFEPSQCPQYLDDMLDKNFYVACLAVKALRANSPELFKWNVKRPVANAPREDVGTAYLVNAKIPDGGLVLVVGPRGECLLSGTTSATNQNAKVTWDSAAATNCSFQQK